jgi:hypothetical protein
MLWHSLFFGWFYYPISIKLVSFPLPHFIMAPCGKHPRLSLVGCSCVAKEAIEVAKFYHEFIIQEDRVVIPFLEAEVKLVREFKEDEEVKH